MKVTTASRSQSVNATMASTAIRWASMGFLVLTAASIRQACGTPVNPALTVQPSRTIRKALRIREITHEASRRIPVPRNSGVLHDSVVDLAVAQRDDVERVVLVEPPRPLRALLGHFRDRALHVAGGEIQRRQFRNRGIDVMRHALLVAAPVHVVDQAADI